MMQNLGFELIMHYDNDDIDINQLKYDFNRLLRKVLLTIFSNVYSKEEEKNGNI